jgi:hypothetical protein
MASQIPSDPANQKIADLTQDQLNVSRGQFARINESNEALGAVIMELAAAQSQAENIEEKKIKREKFYRRKDFIFDTIVSRFQRVAAKKAAIQSENQFNRDLIEQEAQVNAAFSIEESSAKTATIMGFMSKDISKLADFMMGNKLTDEENRREMLDALNKDRTNRGDFKEKRYQGFFKTLAKIVIGVPIFLVGFFQGYFESLGNTFKTAGKFIDKNVFKGFFAKTGDSIKTSFNDLGTNIKTKIGNFFKRFGKKTGISGALERIKTFFTDVSKFFKRLIGPRKIKAAVNAVKFVIGKVAGFFNMIKTTITGSSQFKRFIDFAKRAKYLGKIFGKIFFPIKVIMGVFSFVKGFMKGYDEGGIMEGIKQGLLSLFDTLIGSVLELLANMASVVLNFLGLENAAKAVKESMTMMIDGINSVIGGFVDLVKAIFTLDPVLYMESLGKIWGGIKNILMAGPNYFMALIKDVFGSDEEGEGGLINKVKSIYQKIKDFLLAPFEKISGLLNKLNPFAEDSDKEIEEEIAKERERIRRSQAGENEYVGRETKGVENSLEKIAELQAKLANKRSVNEMKMIPNTTGAQMEATQNDTLIAKEAKTNIAPVITTTDASTNTSTIVSTSTNQNSHVDRTMGLGSGQMQLQ